MRRELRSHRSSLIVGICIGLVTSAFTSWLIQTNSRIIGTSENSSREEGWHTLLSPEEPGIFDVAFNMDPLHRTTCATAILSPATDALFKIAKQAGKGVPYTSTPTGRFTTGELPRNEFDAEDKRAFISELTQEYCPGHSTDDACQQLATNINKFDIPKDVHAMSGGGKGFISGGIYNADMVLEAVYLAPGGRKAWERIAAGGTVLDWGGSSGRSISMMKAAFPLINAHVADPIKKSIQWANANLPDVTGHVSPINPPTRYEGGHFDLIFAISIWSHYNFGPGEMVEGDRKGSALRWLEEMRRIIKPDGFLVITTHGYRSIYSKVTDVPTAEKISKAFEDGTGEFYVAAFPDNVDWDKDTTNPDWGMSWVDPNWLAAKTSKDWKLVVLRNARNDCLQDVIVMRPKQL